MLLGCFGRSYVMLHQRLGKPVDALQKVLAKVSDPSFTENSSAEDVHLTLRAVSITRDIMDVLLRILNYDFDNERREIGSGSGRGKIMKWHQVSFHGCRLVRPVAGQDDPHYCTSGQIRCLASALAMRAQSLAVIASPAILEILLEIPHLQMDKLTMYAREPNTFPRTLDYGIPRSALTRLGNLIQQSVALTSFSLDVPLHNVPSELIESLRSATYLQELSVMGASQGLTQGPSDEWFGGVFIDRFVDHHHPQSQLRRLTLERVMLDDRHFIALTQLLTLPTALIEYLNVTTNNIGTQGIFELARQLPMIHCLKEIVLYGNPWMERYDECVDALSRGMVDNYSMEKSIARNAMLQDMLLTHYGNLNWAGRKILLASNPTVPIALWPLIFARICRTLSSPWDTNAVYYFLQNSPSALLSTTRHDLHSKIPVSRTTKRKYGV